MQKLVVEREAVVPIRLTEEEVEDLDAAVLKIRAKSRSAFIRDAIQKYIQDTSAIRVIEIRSNISLKDATAEIIAHLKKNKQADTFEIANDLRLDVDLTVKALKQLWEEGKVA